MSSQGVARGTSEGVLPRPRESHPRILGAEVGVVSPLQPPGPIPVLREAPQSRRLRPDAILPSVTGRFGLLLLAAVVIGLTGILLRGVLREPAEPEAASAAAPAVAANPAPPVTEPAAV